MRIWGINDSSHDAALTIIEKDSIVFAGHSERYSKQKNTFEICDSLWREALRFGPPDKIAYFERRPLKRLRRAIYGGINGAYEYLYRKKDWPYANCSEIQVAHHKSHASGGFLTSPFEEAAVLVIDAIGEFTTTSIWKGSGTKLKLLRSWKYPFSFGLFYGAFTKALGFQPVSDEYIVMGMAAYGDKEKYIETVESLFPAVGYQECNFHRGIPNDCVVVQTQQDRYDLAAAVQAVYERRLAEIAQEAQWLTKSRNLVFMGGCALNCLANTKLFTIFDDVWIMPNPGDAGSSLGAAAAVNQKRLNWESPYLGTHIGGEYPTETALQHLLECGMVGVANGRAEFGPRALGNRSIFADPRVADMQELLNMVKGREPFRPFAPVVKADAANEWFELPAESPYMQFAVPCKKPQLIPGAVHFDGTSRVQTVRKDQHPGVYELLDKWEQKTGIPLLINTSLNVKGQPIVNDEADVSTFLEKANNEKLVVINVV